MSFAIKKMPMKACKIFFFFYFRFVGYAWHDVKLKLFSVFIDFYRQLRPKEKLFHSMNETPQRKEKVIQNSQVTFEPHLLFFNALVLVAS